MPSWNLRIPVSAEDDRKLSEQADRILDGDEDFDRMIAVQIEVNGWHLKAKLRAAGYTDVEITDVDIVSDGFIRFTVASTHAAALARLFIGAEHDPE